MNGFQDFRLYNVDLIPEQKSFFDHDIFRLGLFEVTEEIILGFFGNLKAMVLGLQFIIYHILKRYI